MMEISDKVLTAAGLKEPEPGDDVGVVEAFTDAHEEPIQLD